MNNEWNSLEKKLMYLCLEHSNNIDCQLLIRTLEMGLIRLMAIKLGISDEDSNTNETKYALDKCIINLTRDYCNEDEKEVLFNLRQFVYKEF